MADYEVNLITDPTYLVTQQSQDEYGIKLNYEPITKGIQYQNLIIDDLTAQFNCNQTVFDLTVSGEPYTPLNDQQLIISVNNIILQPGVGYTVSGSQITFATPPCNTSFFGIALANTADLTRTINYVVDNGSIAMTTGSKGYLTIDVTGSIESWILVSNSPGNLLIDIKKSTFADFPNTISICNGNNPSLQSEAKNSDINLLGWDKTLNAGDIIEYEVINSSTSITRFSIALKIKL